MPIYSILFYFLAAVIAAATVMTVISRSLVHAIVFLVVSFLGTAMLFYLLGAPMLAALEVIIYAGAIMVLFLIVVMVMADESREGPSVLRHHAFFLIGVGGLSFGLVLFFLLTDRGGREDLPLQAVSPRAFGHFVFGHYWPAVEIVSFLLFVALAGAYFLGGNKGSADKGRVAP